ncbi:CsbD family protein [Pedosphaera parvula Ellin514]|uniref:CsbD family protein n=2 Tax=Pedosphaera TaxID=1032526 RepID=B9XH88_PEDPL|nr:CsbD family protein [Pedosphaera parvula Ellin514]
MWNVLLRIKLIMKTKENIKDRVKGSAREAKGKVKEVAGRAMKDRNLEGRGKAEKYAGKAQRKVGEVEKVFDA